MKKLLIYFECLITLLTASIVNGAANENQFATGKSLFQKHCVSCHSTQSSKAPGVTILQKMSSASINKALTSGIMRPMAQHLSPDERQSIVAYLTSGNSTQVSTTQLKQCPKSNGWFDYEKIPLSKGWGITNYQNTRFIPEPISQLTIDAIKKLTLKWSFSFPDSVRARTQPVVAGNALFTAGSDGTVYALNPNSGCFYWTFKADAGIKTSITIDDWTGDGRDIGDGPSIYFGDVGSTVYAVDALSGELRWQRKVDDHQSALIAGSVIKHKNQLYVPVASAEATMPIDPNYSCCTFRGSVSALNADTGKVLWKTYAIPNAPTEQGKNTNGTPQLGPSGAGVWNSPTIDENRGRIYVGTGENGSSPAENGGAVIAIDMIDGKIAWVMQAAPGEAYNASCTTKYSSDEINCPKEYKGRFGLDIGSSPVLLEDNKGRNILIVGQKTGWVFGLDPDRDGKIIWRRSISRGDYNKGVLFGMAVDQETIFTTVYDLYADPLKETYFGVEELGVHALNAFTGKWIWSAPVSRDCTVQRCRGYTAALTTIPGAVFAGSQDGYLRVLDSKNGELLWQFNTSIELTDINGMKSTGGNISGPGPIVIGGNVYLNAGNSLLVFSANEK